MGGSSSNYSNTNRNIEDLIFDSQKESMQKAVKSEINGFIESILKNVNKRDINTINTHLNTIKKALEKDIEGTIDLYFGGSVKKYTYVNGLSDIDMLVKLNDTSLQNKTPKEVLKYFESRLRERLPNTNITVGTLAVTVKFSSGNEIQILPSIKQGSGYKIATADGIKWSNLVKPDKFTEKLTSVNKSNGNRVIPIIKILKIINENQNPNNQLKGYHIESLAIKAFKTYNGRNDYYSMLSHFCNSIKDDVLCKIVDKTGQSIHVDEYLGENNSIERKRISNCYNRINNILNSTDINQIKNLIELR